MLELVGSIVALFFILIFVFLIIMFGDTER